MSYEPARAPWAHQKEGLAKRRGRGGEVAEAFAYLLGMRLGKTKMLLDDFGELEEVGEVINLMIVAPGGVYKTWSGAGTEEKGAVEIDFSPDLLRRTKVHVWESGDSALRTRLREEFMKETDKCRVLIMNVEALSSVKKAREMARRFLSLGPAMLAIDESTIIKNYKAIRTRFIVETLGSLAAYRRILSGLPTPRSPLDIWSQFYFLDWRILGAKSYWAFAAQYATIEKKRFGRGPSFTRVKPDSYHDIDRIQKLIEPYSYRKTLDEVYDLPPKSWAFRDVEMTKEQDEKYQEMKTYATTRIAEEKHVTATIVIVQIMKLHQICCGHVSDEEGEVHPIPENRTAAMLELFEEYDGKAIIWASYDYDVKRIAEAIDKEYGEGSCARFWGGNQKVREVEERRFLSDPLCRFMVATPAAGGRGRTWTVANLVVYFSSTYDLEHRSQSEERPQGVGKKQSVHYVDLRIRGTVEEKIIRALRDKIDLATVITGDTYKEWLI
jgi:hypothetical protein